MAAKYLVRHGTMRFLGEFTPSDNRVYTRGTQVVVRTDRGQEHGELLGEATEQAMALLSGPTHGQILRSLTAEDRQKLVALQEASTREYDLCHRLIEQKQLPMELVDVEHLLGGERVVFYFLAEKRVDFRELVKELARELKTRIEMRQIGVRDEAKLLADYGDCGKPVCCNTHMSVMPPVSMRMAKIQKSTLDPSKISGRCGRLKCCLRFEQHVYEEFQEHLPSVGSRILTRKGQGKVLAQEILARKVLAEFEDGRRVIVPLDEILNRTSS